MQLAGAVSNNSKTERSVLHAADSHIFCKGEYSQLILDDLLETKSQTFYYSLIFKILYNRQKDPVLV